MNRAALRAGVAALARVAKTGIAFEAAMANVAKYATATREAVERLAASMNALDRLGGRGAPGDLARLTEAILRRDRLVTVTMSDGVCRVVCRPRLEVGT